MKRPTDPSSFSRIAVLTGATLALLLVVGCNPGLRHVDTSYKADGAWTKIADAPQEAIPRQLDEEVDEEVDEEADVAPVEPDAEQERDLQDPPEGEAPVEPGVEQESDLEAPLDADESF